MKDKDRIAALEKELEKLRRENLALRHTLIRSGLALNHERILERDIQLKKETA